MPPPQVTITGPYANDSVDVPAWNGSLIYLDTDFAATHPGRLQRSRELQALASGLVSQGAYGVSVQDTSDGLRIGLSLDSTWTVVRIENLAHWVRAYVQEYLGQQRYQLRIVHPDRTYYLHSEGWLTQEPYRVVAQNVPEVIETTITLTEPTKSWWEHLEEDL